jgi:hypothetical protein
VRNPEKQAQIDAVVRSQGFIGLQDHSLQFLDLGPEGVRSNLPIHDQAHEDLQKARPGTSEGAGEVLFHPGNDAGTRTDKGSVNLTDQGEGPLIVLREQLAEAMEGEDPESLGPKGLPPSIDPLGRPDALSPAQDPVDFVRHPLGLRQDPVFL